jgi:hypothetical protein
MTPLQKRLVSMGACEEARTWVAERTLKQAWAECEDPRWMFWFAARMGVDRKLIVEAACQCAEMVVEAFVPTTEDRPRKAIETARAWTRGEATPKEVRKAADAAAAYTTYAARAAAYAAATTTAAACADAAAYTAYAADNAARAAAYAAATTTAAACAYAYTAYDVAKQSLKEMADIVRGVITLQDIPKELPK